MNISKLGRYYPIREEAKADSSSVSGANQSSEIKSANSNGEIISSIIGTVGTLVQNAVKYEKDKKARAAEVARVQEREDTAYTRAAIDQYRAGIRSDGKESSASSSVAPTEMPITDTATAGTALGSALNQTSIANQQADIAEAQMAQNERLTLADQQIKRTNNAYANMGNYLGSYQNMLDFSISQSLQNKTFFGAQRTALLGYLAEQNNTTTENVSGTLHDITMGITSTTKKVVSNRVSKGASAHAEVGKGNQKQKGEKNGTRTVNDWGEKIREDFQHSKAGARANNTEEKTKGGSVIKDIIDDVLDVVKINFEVAAEGHITWDDLTQEDKEEIFNDVVKWSDTTTKKNGITTLRLSDRYRKKVFEQLKEFDDEYSKASDEYDNYQDRKSNFTRSFYDFFKGQDFQLYSPF